MPMVPIAYNIRSLARRRRTTLATMAGIALVVFVVSASLMLAHGVNEALSLSAGDDAVIVLRKGSDAEFGSVIDRSDVGVILSAPGVRANADGSPQGVAELMVVTALDKLGGEKGQVANLQVRGVPQAALDFRPQVRIIAGRALRPGSDEAIIGARLRGRFPGVELGQSFELRKNRRLTVVGVFEADAGFYESEIWADVDTLSSEFGREGIVSSVRARLESPVQFVSFRDQLQADKRLGVTVLREKEFLEQQSQGIATLVTALGSVIGVFFSLAATLGAMITMYAAVEQRRTEVGLLRALGFSGSSVLFSLTMESLGLALAAGAIGALASLAMASVKFSMVNFATWSEIVIAFSPTPGTIFTSIAVAGIMGLVGGLFPALRGARGSLNEGLRV
jgi:putative ABC transport system permease protein